MDHQVKKGISLYSDTPYEFFFIHGYTGGITDFADLPNILHQRFHASITCPILPGHGTFVTNLFGLTHEDLVRDIESEIARRISNGKQVVLVGLSFGAQVALYLATKYDVAGIISIAVPHGLRFPFNLPGIGILARLKRTWKKRLSDEELARRKDAMFYNEMVSDGFFASRALSNLVERDLHKIKAPLLFIHSRNEPLGDPRAIHCLAKGVSSRVVSQHLINQKSHHLFFSDAKQKVIDTVISFIEETDLFGVSHGVSKGTSHAKEEKATAIVSSYNEGARIGIVLEALVHTPSIGEIIVVDDGSSDDTESVVKKFKDVRYLKNDRNVGKGESMDRGVKEARNDIIFFCDADLIGFLPKHAEAIIAPVQKREYEMYIGMRGNLMQRTVRAWGLNSGERALRKAIWEKLPKYYKYRYRIEAGLNYYVKHYTKKKFGYEILDYSQTLKESKYGPIRGTILRWWMNFDVLTSYMSYFFISKLSKPR